MGSRSDEVPRYGRNPSQKEEARKIKRRATRFTQVDRVLYKQGFSTPLLRCISPQETQYILAEVHEGTCRNHSKGRALVRKVARVGYYWPHALKDAKEFMKR